MHSAKKILPSLDLSLVVSVGYGASIIIVHACVISSLYLSISNTSSSSFDEHNFYGILTIYDIQNKRYTQVFSTPSPVLMVLPSTQRIASRTLLV